MLICKHVLFYLITELFLINSRFSWFVILVLELIICIYLSSLYVCTYMRVCIESLSVTYPRFLLVRKNNHSLVKKEF